jgi:hypothetical protein
MLTLLPKGEKIVNNFLIEDFSFYHRFQRHQWSTLSCEYPREFSKKFENPKLDALSLGGI